MYTARDRIDNAVWLTELDAAVDTLELSTRTRSTAEDLFLSALPETDRSKRAALAASLYTAALIAGEQRSQTAVAEAVGVSRLSIQKRWKTLVEEAGLEPPDW